jgi:penicillin-binding protein 2
MLKKISEKLRAFLFVILTVGLLSLGVVRLMKIQVVDGAEYADEALSTRSALQIISSPRGEIRDRNGLLLVGNKVGYNVILEKAFFPADSDKAEQNRVIAETVAVLYEHDAPWLDTLPITTTRPYEFLSDRESDIAKLRKNINVQPYATASDCIDACIKLFEIADTYTLSEQRTLAGIRYEMILRSFSIENTYTFAEDIPLEAVASLKEKSYRLPGTDVIAQAIRYVGIGDAAPHLIGTIGAITSEEYDAHREDGYALNDSIGKSGIELAMEDELRGVKGVRTFEMYRNEVVSDTITTDAVPGHSVKLTFDVDYQRKIQQILKNDIDWLTNQTSDKKKGEKATGGAIVVLDASGADAGAVLAAATYPTYDLADYKTDYAALGSDPTLPLYNRATSGLYRPGSTFKTVTATAALNEGYIDLNTTIVCSGKYTYWSDYQPRCTTVHGRLNVIHALEHSCNIFFYEVGRVMGIDTIDRYAALYGFGQPTGLETGGASGWVASPALFEQKKLDWQAGLVVQAAIGQSETNVTPMQLAVLAVTLANDGVRYRPHLVDSIYDYNMNNLLSKTPVEIMAAIPEQSGITFTSIKEGMELAANFAPYSYPTETDYYTDYLLTELPGGVAIKTGTPQMTSAEDTGSAFIGYYPADDPQIAFSGFIEHGEWSKLMIRQIIDAYLDDNYVVKYPVIPLESE